MGRLAQSPRVKERRERAHESLNDHQSGVMLRFSVGIGGLGIHLPR